MDGISRKSPIISLEELLKKDHKFVSSEEALRDVDPPGWSKNILDKKTRVVVGTKDEVL